MSINAQLCSYCITLGHKVDKCSCPSLMELFVRTVQFVQAINTTNPGREEEAADWLNENHNPKKIKVLARNLKLTQNMSASYIEARTCLIRHITQRIYSQPEVEFANRVSFRVGEGDDIMVEYRRIPQPSSLSEYRASARIAVHDTRTFILGMSLEDRRRFVVELNNARANVDLIERFMEIYSGHRFQTGNLIIANYYVNMIASTVSQLRRQPTDWEAYLRERIQQNTQRRQAQQVHPRNVVPPAQQGQDPNPHPQPQAPPPLPQRPLPHHVQAPRPPRPVHRDVLPQPIRNKAKVIKVASFVMPFECPICYEPVVGKCIITTCGHQYCAGCFVGVSNMFDRHTGTNTCSLCRGVLSSVVECSVVVEQSSESSLMERMKDAPSLA